MNNEIDFNEMLKGALVKDTPKAKADADPSIRSRMDVIAILGKPPADYGDAERDIWYSFSCPARFLEFRHRQIMEWFVTDFKRLEQWRDMERDMSGDPMAATRCANAVNTITGKLLSYYRVVNGSSKITYEGKK